MEINRTVLEGNTAAYYPNAPLDDKWYIVKAPTKRFRLLEWLIHEPERKFKPLWDLYKYLGGQTSLTGRNFKHLWRIYKCSTDKTPDKHIDSHINLKKAIEWVEFHEQIRVQRELNAKP
jgi:hypothetical protein